MHVTGIEEEAKLIRSLEPTECSASAVLLHTYFAGCASFAFFYNPLIVPELKKKSYMFCFGSPFLFCFFLSFFFLLLKEIP